MLLNEFRILLELSKSLPSPLKLQRCVPMRKVSVEEDTSQTVVHTGKQVTLLKLIPLLIS
jgi:hypothetical protein